MRGDFNDVTVLLFDWPLHVHVCGNFGMAGCTNVINNSERKKINN